MPPPVLPAIAHPMLRWLPSLLPCLLAPSCVDAHPKWLAGACVPMLAAGPQPAACLAACPAARSNPLLTGSAFGDPGSETNLMRWKCFIPGKEGTIWEGGFYPLTMEFTEVGAAACCHLCCMAKEQTS